MTSVIEELPHCSTSFVCLNLLSLFFFSLLLLLPTGCTLRYSLNGISIFLSFIQKNLCCVDNYFHTHGVLVLCSHNFISWSVMLSIFSFNKPFWQQEHLYYLVRQLYLKHKSTNTITKLPSRPYFITCTLTIQSFLPLQFASITWLFNELWKLEGTNIKWLHGHVLRSNRTVP